MHGHSQSSIDNQNGIMHDDLSQIEDSPLHSTKDDEPNRKVIHEKLHQIA